MYHRCSSNFNEPDGDKRSTPTSSTTLSEGLGGAAAIGAAVDMGLTDSHPDAVVENLGATLKELGVPDDLIGEAAALAESVRGEVLN